MTHKLDYYWFRYWLVACLAPSHYLDQAYCSVKFGSKYDDIHSWKWIWKCHLWNSGHFVSRALSQRALIGQDWVSISIMWIHEKKSQMTRSPFDMVLTQKCLEMHGYIFRYSSLLLLMPWCQSTRPSVSTVLNNVPCFGEECFIKNIKSIVNGIKKRN